MKQVVNVSLFAILCFSADVDYVDIATVHWVFTAGSQAGDTHCVEIVIIDDGYVEGDEYFAVNLTTSDEDVKLKINYAAIRILDDDGEYIEI